MHNFIECRYSTCTAADILVSALKIVVRVEGLFVLEEQPVYFVLPRTGTAALLYTVPCT